MSKAKLITTVADALLGGGNKAMKANTSDFVSKLKYSSSPIGRKGQSKNMKAFGYQLREQNPLITNKEMNEAFGSDVIDSYIKLRSSEIKEFDNVEKFDKSKPITKWERQNTLDC